VPASSLLSRIGPTAASAVQQELPRPTVRTKFAKKEIRMNSPERINDDLPDTQHPDEMTQQPTDELLEIEPAKLEQVAGGGDGTALGVGKN
jgi:hypothetical protein